MFTSPEAQFAVEAVRQVAQMVRTVQQGLVTPALTKGDKSPVTVADFAAQALLGCLLAKHRPQDSLVGEEEAADLRAPSGQATLEQVLHFVRQHTPTATAEEICAWIDRGTAAPSARFWTLDPVDGTKGFLRKEQYAVALAHLVDGQVQVGVLGCPNLSDAQHAEPGGPGSLVVAVRGQGAFTARLDGGEFRRLHVSDRRDPATARLLRSVESGHTNADQIGEMAGVMGARAEPVRMDSQAKYAVLAAGAGEVLLRLLSPSQPDYRERIWDQAAGSLVVEEAGGRVSDLDGRPFDFTQGRTLAKNRGVVATNGALHQACLAALRQVGA